MRLGVLLLVGLVSLAACRQRVPVSRADYRARIMALKLPDEFKPSAALYSARCSTCHGPRAVGSVRGPRLIHTMYHKKYHDDSVFARAVRLGVHGHHWGFGDMPAAGDLSDDDVADITIYIRWLQYQVGIR
ncbi:MAG: cytochrome c [Gemmatimonadetes bacterium]|nr:cytochrome c [Gemmatimonadota bacterium]